MAALHGMVQSLCSAAHDPKRNVCSGRAASLLCWRTRGQVACALRSRAQARNSA